MVASNQSNPLKVVTNFGRKFIKPIGGVFIIGTLLILFDREFLENKCNISAAKDYSVNSILINSEISDTNNKSSHSYNDSKRNNSLNNKTDNQRIEDSDSSDQISELKFSELDAESTNKSDNQGIENSNFSDGSTEIESSDQLTESSGQLNETYPIEPKWCLMNPLVGDVGSSLVGVAIITWFLDIESKRELLKEIKEIVGYSESTKAIKGFHRNQMSYANNIQRSLCQAENEDIKILSLYNDTQWFLNMTSEEIKKIVARGVHIRVLVIDPDSKLTECLKETGFTDVPSTFQNSHNNLIDRVKRLEDKLISINNIKGSIEIRKHKDLFSPIGYYSDSRHQYVWIYLMNEEENTGYPAFHIADGDFRQEIDNHFEHLWFKSKDDLQCLLQVPNKRGINI